MTRVREGIHLKVPLLVSFNQCTDTQAQKKRGRECRTIKGD